MTDFIDLIRSSGMTIIGISGRRGSGKSTFADELASKHPLPMKVAFADPIRSMALTIFGSEYRTQEEKAATDAFWSDRLGDQWSTGRKILQRLGTEIGRDQIHQDLWLMVMERRLSALAARVHGGHPKPLVTIDDARFANEAELVKKLGGTVIRLVNTTLGPNEDQHASEAGLPDELVDHTFYVSDADSVRRTATAYAVCAKLWPEKKPAKNLYTM